MPSKCSPLLARQVFRKPGPDIRAESGAMKYKVLHLGTSRPHTNICWWHLAEKQDQRQWTQTETQEPLPEHQETFCQREGDTALGHAAQRGCGVSILWAQSWAIHSC